MTEAQLTERDARSRAWRSFLWGLLVDVASGVTLVLVTMVGDLQWTRTYWIGLGLAVAKSAVQGVVAYFGRKLLKPPT